MLFRRNYILPILLVTIVFMVLAEAAKAPAPAKRSGHGTEFHLTCTVLVNGAVAGGEHDGVDERSKGAPAAKKGKGRRKREVRSLRVKRNAKKVQLLCDIDNPKGAEIAERSVKKRHGDGHGGVKDKIKGKIKNFAAEAAAEAEA